MQLMSQEWAIAYTEVWNNDEQVVKKLKKFSSTLKYSITDRKDLAPVVIEVEHGICISFGSPEQYQHIEFEIWADSKSWIEVFKNAKEIKHAMDLDGFDFKGPKIKAVLNKKGLERSVELLIRMEGVTV